jgi:hypothetical protein
VRMSGAEGRETYAQLRARFAVTPVPTMRCKGCKNCGCSGKHGVQAYNH